jgi:hypothetical protein
MILELRHRDKTWMTWLKYIMKVRPQDPSCVAWYTHMDTLCWNLSVSTTRRKSWWTHWVCGDPRLPIRNTRYAYNSRSHDQCVVNPHIRVDNRITSSITVPNNILTIGHMTKYDIATQGKFTTNQRIPSNVADPRHAYYPTGNWLGDGPSSHQRRRNHHHLH